MANLFFMPPLPCERREFILFYPDIETVRIYAKQFTHIPLCYQMPYDGQDVVTIYEKFKGAYSFLLESGEQTYQGRYSIIALPCTHRIKASENFVEEYKDGSITRYETQPIEYLKQVLEKKSPIYPNLPVFTGGAIGHINYDCIRLYEDITCVEKQTLDLPLYQFGIASELIVIDHKTSTITFITNLSNDAIDNHAYDEGVQRIEHMLFRYKEKCTPCIKQAPLIRLTSNYTKDAFMQMVETAKQHIYQGDIFQVVLSQRMQSDYDGDPLLAYRSLRTSGASPYMYYLDFDSYVIAGVSPELLLQARGNHIKTMPIAGTRKRGCTKEEDQMLANDLKLDPKENAEHMMLVDLGRNDIGKVSTIGSVHVKNMKEIQLYSHVMHMTSEVHGCLQNDLHVLDALCSVLPAGTLSGAPKIRAMQLIEELENTKREVYGGAIGFLGFNGQFDTCITIRTMVFHNKQVYIQAGAGIVKDSDPAKEYEETLQKAKVLLSALSQEVTL